MKELSIKEKAEAYDEALDRAKKLYEQGTITESLSYVFPELKEESEDEKIKKAIYSALKYLEGELSWDMLYNRVDILDAYAWLEKQGKQSIQNVPSRKVILAIWDLGNEWKELTNGCISTEYGTQLDYIQKHWKESEYYLRAKQGERKPQRMISAEAKEAMYGKPIDKVELKFRVGDVVCDKSCTTLDKGAQPNYEIVDIRNGLYICDKGYIPISYQDEYELVAKKIENEIEIPFGAKDSELQEATYFIPQGFHAEIDNDKVVIKKGEKPTTWSEEDEKMIQDIINDIAIAQEQVYCKSRCEDEINWLKSLKERVGCEANCTTTWKPSEKQMEALKEACDEHWEPDGLDPLYTLYQELKKLREE